MWTPTSGRAPCPHPGGAEQLRDAVGQIASRPLDRSRPLWELHLIHGLRGGRVAMLTKLHDSAIDGVSGIEMLGALLDPTPTARREIPPPAVPATTAGEDPSDVDLLARAVVSLPRQPVRMVRGLPATLRHIDELPTMRTLPGAGVISGAADRAARIATRTATAATCSAPARPPPGCPSAGRSPRTSRILSQSVRSGRRPVGAPLMVGCRAG